MNRLDRIKQVLHQELAPSHCHVIDESHKHAGHQGASPAGETHYKVEISSPLFQGRSIIDCHRMVNAALAAEFETGLHALSIVIPR